MKSRIGCAVLTVIFLIPLVLYILWLEKNRYVDPVEAELRFQLGQIYREFVYSKGKPPTSIHDFEEFKDLYPQGFAAYQNQDFIMTWDDTPFSKNPDGDTYVVGYHKNLFKNRSWVLRKRGNISVMDYRDYLAEVQAIQIAREIGKMYQKHLLEKKIPPLKIEDLANYQETYPLAYKAIEKGEWTVRWNTIPSKIPIETYDQVLAYSKEAAQAVGWALMADYSPVFLGGSEYSLMTNLKNVPIGHEIWHLYTDAANKLNRPPKDLEELRPFQDQYPKAFIAIMSGDWIIRWNTKISGIKEKDRHVVLAYPHDITSVHGHLLMLNNYLCKSRFGNPPATEEDVPVFED